MKDTLEKVRFLALMGPAVETHRSWVFLTDDRAYKLKKAARTEFFDWTTAERRHQACLEELRLNRRLAPDVYLGVTPLVRAPGGGFRLGGPGQPVDWLVVMRRLPEALMLNELLAKQRIGQREAQSLAGLLKQFYRRAEKVPMEEPDYLERILADIDQNRRELAQAGYQVDKLASRLASAASRVLPGRAGAVLEGHGDLRPEHVCLESPPVIIDCLDFSRDLRLLDPLDEVGFLALECDRLGDPRFGRLVLEAFGEFSGELVQFYQAYRALTRARLAAWHPTDHRPNDHWRKTTQQYLAHCRRRLTAGLLG